MPHAELKYSTDLPIDAADILRRIEQVIAEHDPKAGDCKGRAYPAEVYHHSHILIAVSMLSRPYRDAEFTAALRDALEQAIKAMIPVACAFSLGITYSDAAYVTNLHQPGRP